MRAAIYARKSTESDDRQCLSLSAQVEWAKATCAKLGIHDPLLFQESRSAKTRGRPEFGKLMKLVEAGEVDTIVCWKADRLARNAADAGAVLDALESQALRHVITSDRPYTDEADSVLMLNIDFGFSAKFSKDLSKNVRRGMEEKWRRGEWSFLAPVGYRNVRLTADRAVIEVDPTTAPFVKRLFELAASGNYSLNRLANIVRDEWNITLRPSRCTKSARGVSPSAIDTILKNPFYTGVMLIKGTLYQGSHPPLVTRATFEQVQHVMHARFRTAERAKTLSFTFNGILQCGECGRRLSGYRKRKPSGREYQYYVCGKHLQGKCSQPQLSEDDILSVVLPALDAVSLNDEEYSLVVAEINEARGRVAIDHEHVRARAEDGVRDLEQQKSKLLDLFVNGAVSKEDYSRKNRELEERRASLLLSADAEIESDEVFDLVEKAFSSLLDAGKVFRLANEDGRRELLRKLEFELVAMGKKALVHAGFPAAIVGSRGDRPLWWRLVDIVWNCVFFSLRIHRLLSRAVPGT